jgi:hypothetical protein
MAGRGGGRSRDHNVKASKALSLILRHKATDMGLDMRPDGYVELDVILLSHPFSLLRSLICSPFGVGTVGSAACKNAMTLNPYLILIVFICVWNE